MKPRRRGHSFFYITEDPPVTLTNFKKISNTSQIKGAIPKNYFFMDFTQDCTLRAMTKIEDQHLTIESASQLERFGKNIVTNVEDSSPEANQSLKYCDQLMQLLQKKRAIRKSIQRSLEKSKEKERSNSSYSIKQSLKSQFRRPEISKFMLYSAPQKLAELNNKLIHKQNTVLSRLGLLRKQ